MKQARRSLLTLAVSGSRIIRDASVVRPLLDDRAIYYMLAFPDHDLHWHFGEAQGVDALSLLWAREYQRDAQRTVFFASLEMAMSFKPEVGERVVMAADWSKDGYAAGPIRNGAMLRGEGCPVAGCHGADVLLAIWDGTSRGTLNARMQARALNIPCMTYQVTAPESGWVEEDGPPAIG